METIHWAGRIVTAVALAGLAVGCRCDSRSSEGHGAVGGGQAVTLVPVARGFRSATDVQFVPGATSTAVVLTKDGTARVAELRPQAPAQAGKAKVLFEVEVRQTSELGLLGLAFHPDFANNGRFFVNYNPADGERRTRVAEWRVAPHDLGESRAQEVEILLELAQPYENHDGGQLAFGPDGFLYIAIGDGGSANDPHSHGQNLSTLLGTIARIDVDRRDGGRGYGIPADNPFRGRSDARAEIFAYGLRNPWRFSWDGRGRLIVADVGQNEWEEIDIVARGDNLGWNFREGTHCFRPPQDCPRQGLVDPIIEYGHDVGKSVTGGYELTGSACPRLAGKYVFADFVSGRLWAASLPEQRQPVQAELVGQFEHMFATFGRDAAGNGYLADFGSGDIFRIECLDSAHSAQ